MIAESVDVALVRMPYGELGQPSLALGLLKSCLDREEISNRVVPANLWFGEQIGPALHDLIFHSYSTTLVGEWTFAKALFPDFEPNSRAYLEKIGKIFAIDKTSEYRYLRQAHPNVDLPSTLRQVREATTAFVEHVADRVAAMNPKIVGCSSTFQQHTASLAFLRAIKQRLPHVITMIGGANCEERMGQLTFERFEFVDFVVSGDADGFFGPLAKTLLEKGVEGLSLPYPTGVMGPKNREQEASVSTEDCEDGAPIARLDDMDQSPIPNYDDYFSELKETDALGQYLRPALPFQTARGCWWGAKSHCSFCGISRTAMKFRSKSAPNVMGQMVALRDKYGINTFQGTEYIFDYKYFKTLLPQLKELNSTFRFEVKANLRPEQIHSFIEAGVVEVQPGVESMHDEILKRLKKGTTAFNNVLLLRRGKEAGLSIYWNLLHTLPDDEDHWYEEMADLLPALHHLQAPVGFAQIHYDRFSPYWKDAKEHGLDLLPAFGYQMVYPFSPEDLWDIAYFFETQDQRDRFLDIQPETRPGLSKLVVAMDAWRAWSQVRVRPELYVTSRDGRRVVVDTRDLTPEQEYEVSELADGILKACSEGCPPAKLHAKMVESGWDDLGEEELESELQGLLDRYVVMSLSGKLLTLAVEGVPAEMAFKRLTKPVAELSPMVAKIKADALLEKQRVNPVLAHRLSHPLHRQSLGKWLGELSPAAAASKD